MSSFHRRHCSFSVAVAFVLTVVCSAARADVGSNCSAIEQQLTRDQHALLTEQRSISQNIDALHEWSAKEEEAWQHAAKLGVKLLFSSAAQTLEHAAENARMFDEFLKKRNISFMLLARTDAKPIIKEAFQEYKRASWQALTAAGIDAANTVDDVGHNVIKPGVDLAARRWAEGDEALRRTLDDSELRDYMNADEEGRALRREILSTSLTLSMEFRRIDELFDKKIFERLGQKVSLGASADLSAFFVDYGYDYKQWTESAAAILQSARLSQQQLTAVNGLTRQLHRTTARLRSCHDAAATFVAAAAPTAPAPPTEAERAGRERNEAIVRAETLKSAQYEPPAWTEELLGSAKPRAFRIEPLPQMTTLRIWDGPQFIHTPPIQLQQLREPIYYPPQLELRSQQWIRPEIPVMQKIPELQVVQPAPHQSKTELILGILAGAAMVYGAVKGGSHPAQIMGVPATVPRGTKLCRNPAYDAAIAQQQMLLQRGDPQSVQAAGPVSHGGQGPTGYVSPYIPCSAK